MARKFKHQAAVDAILAKLKTLPDETETCTSDIVKELSANRMYSNSKTTLTSTIA